MNAIRRSLAAVVCSVAATVCIAHVSVVRRDLELGQDAETREKLVVKAVAFEKKDADVQPRRWHSVLPCDDDLFFLVRATMRSAAFPSQRYFSLPNHLRTKSERR